MDNPATQTDVKLQEILERKFGNQGEKVLVQEEQKRRMNERIAELEEALLYAVNRYKNAEAGNFDQRIEELEKGIQHAINGFDFTAPEYGIRELRKLLGKEGRGDE